MPRTIARMEEEIGKREADIKARDEAKSKLPEDAPFEMTVKGTSFRDRGAAGSALLAAIREIPPKVRTEIGEVMGFRLFAESYTSKINPENVGQHTIRLSIQGQHEYVVPSWSGHPEGSVASITNEIKGWPKDLEDARKEHERAKRRLADVQVRLQDAGFAQAKRLTDLETELGQLDPSSKPTPRDRRGPSWTTTASRPATRGSRRCRSMRGRRNSARRTWTAVKPTSPTRTSSSTRSCWT